MTITARGTFFASQTIDWSEHTQVKSVTLIKNSNSLRLSVETGPGLTMDLHEVKTAIVDRVRATRQQVALAKIYMVGQAKNHPTTGLSTEALIKAFLQEMRAPQPERIHLTPATDPAPIIVQFSESLSLHLAASQALWELISGNIIVPSAATGSRGPILTYSVQVPYQVSDAGGGGQGGGLRFDEILISAPNEVMLDPTQRFEPTYNLSDADLFLKELSIPDLNPVIEDALRDAIACFDRDLYSPVLQC